MTSFLQTTWTWIDAIVGFDRNALALVNAFAQRSPTFDTLVLYLSQDPIFQGGIVMAMYWWAWFAQGETAARPGRREIILSTFLGTFVAVCLALALRAALPFRTRPLYNLDLAFRVPCSPAYSLPPASATSTSFPSGHAAVFFALSTGLLFISRTLGLLGFLHALFIVSLTRIYFGVHYPSDILAGAVVGILSVSLVNVALRKHSLARSLLAWSHRYPGAFYSLLFLWTVEIITFFTNVTTFGSFAGHLLKTVIRWDR